MTGIPPSPYSFSKFNENCGSCAVLVAGTSDCFCDVCSMAEGDICKSSLTPCDLSSSWGLMKRPADPLDTQSADSHQPIRSIKASSERCTAFYYTCYYLVLFDRINRHSWCLALRQLEHGNPTTEASHLTRFLLHLSHAVARRCLWCGLCPEAGTGAAVGGAFTGTEASITPQCGWVGASRTSNILQLLQLCMIFLRPRLKFALQRTI